MWMLVKPRDMAMCRPSSMAMDSAQPMSRPSRFHPSLSFHASHSFSMTTPMPKEVDASTKSCMFEMGGGRESGVGGDVFDRAVCHHTRSRINAWGGDFCMWGEFRKFHDVAKVDSRVR